MKRRRETGEGIQVEGARLTAPSEPIIPYIRGDGVGVDVTPVMIRVIDAAVDRAYDGERCIRWMKILAGDEAIEASGLSLGEIEATSLQERRELYLPPETVEKIKKYYIAIKGPLTTPVGGGFRSLNVALRQILDLYACVRPVKWYEGIPAPLIKPEKLDVVIFRENTEDVYAGIEWEMGSAEAVKARRFITETMGHSIRNDSAIGIKPVSVYASKRLVRAAVEYALKNKRSSLTLVHKGNIMKYTEGAFMRWGYEVAVEEFRDHVVTETEYGILFMKDKHPHLTYSGLKEKLRESGYYDLEADSIKNVINAISSTHGGRLLENKLLVKDRIADQMFQQLLLRPEEYDVIATTNLNGDYLSDACAAMVGGLGIAPGANINYETGMAVFEATHGSAPKHSGLDKVNPSSMILSAILMLRYLGWIKAAEKAEEALKVTFQNKKVTYDLHRQMKGAELLTTSQFGEEVIKNIS